MVALLTDEFYDAFKEYCEENRIHCPENVPRVVVPAGFNKEGDQLYEVVGLRNGYDMNTIAPSHALIFES